MHHQPILKILRDLSLKNDLLDVIQSNSTIWELRNQLSKITIDKCKVYSQILYTYYYSIQSFGKHFNQSYKVISDTEDVYLHSQFVITNEIYKSKGFKQILIDMRTYFKQIINFNHLNLCTIHQVKLSDRDGILILDILEESTQMYTLISLFKNVQDYYSSTQHIGNNSY